MGWIYLADGSGSGQLPQGGFYTTFVDPNSANFTIKVVKIDHTHAYCTRPGLPAFTVAAERVTFSLAASMGTPVLSVWLSNFQNYSGAGPMFQQLADIHVGADHTFSLDVAVGATYTISTVTTAQKGSFGPSPVSVTQFPIPYSDDFNR